MSEAPAIETAPPPRVGHNLNFFNEDGGLAADALREYLIEAQQSLVERRTELLDAYTRVPAKIGDDETHKRCLDFSKQLGTLIKLVDADHTARKQPFLAGGQLVDNRWHELRDRVVTVRVDVDRRAKKYLDDKAEAERKARIAAQRAAEEEAARQRAEAEAAEQAMMEKVEPTVEDLDTAIAAGEAASKAETVAVVATRAAEAKPAELARTRTELGALGTLQRVFIFTDLNRDTIDLEALRPHLPTDCIEKALRSFIKAGGREITGATIKEDTALRVR
jgi:hypothetical protein